MEARTSGPVSFYLYEDEVASRLATRSYRIDSPATAPAHPDALIEPLRLIEDSPVKEYEGGVCTRDFEFIAGQHRAWDTPHTIRSCERCYTCPPEEIERLDEEVIFGGILCNHFGHMIMDTASRLWYVISHPECTARIAFVTLPATPTFFNPGDMHYRFLEMLGIPTDRVLLVWKPTQFRRVIVPDETMFLEGGGSYRQEALITYDRLHASVTPSPHRKIYLTRTNYTDLNPIVGEEAFEDYFRSRGYEVISPELLSFEEQVALFAGATHIAGTVGSHTLLLCCAQDGVECVFLNRSSVPVPEHVMVSHMRKARASYVDAHLDFLPEDHIHGVFLMGDTPCWQRFLKDNPSLADAGSPLENRVEDLLPRYVRTWGEQINTDLMYRYVRDEGLPELAYRLNRYFLHSQVDRSDYGPMSTTETHREELRAAHEEALRALAMPQTRCEVEVQPSDDGRYDLSGTVALPLVSQVTDAELLVRGQAPGSGALTCSVAPVTYTHRDDEQSLSWTAVIDTPALLDSGVLSPGFGGELVLSLSSGSHSHTLGLTAGPGRTCSVSPSLVVDGFLPCLDAPEHNGLLSITWENVDSAMRRALACTLEDAKPVQGHDGKPMLALKGRLDITRLDGTPSFSVTLGANEESPCIPVTVSRTPEDGTAIEAEIEFDHLVEHFDPTEQIDVPLRIGVDWHGHHATIPMMSQTTSPALAQLKACSSQVGTTLVTFHQDSDDRLFVRLTPVTALIKRRPKVVFHSARWTSEGLELTGFIRSTIICARGFSFGLSSVDSGTEHTIRHTIPLTMHWDKGYYADFSETIPYGELGGPARPLVARHLLRITFSCDDGTKRIPLDKRLFSLSTWQRTVHALLDSAPLRDGIRYVIEPTEKGQLRLIVSRLPLSPRTLCSLLRAYGTLRRRP